MPAQAMQTKYTLLSRILPCYESSYIRLHKFTEECRLVVEARGGTPDKFTISLIGKTSVNGGDSIVVVRTCIGMMTFAASAMQWPALKNIGLLPDSDRRNAITTLLLRDLLSINAHFLESANFRHTSSSEAYFNVLRINFNDVELDVLHADEALLAAISKRTPLRLIVDRCIKHKLKVAMRFVVGARVISLKVLRSLRHSDVLLIDRDNRCSPRAKSNELQVDSSMSMEGDIAARVFVGSTDQLCARIFLRKRLMIMAEDLKLAAEGDVAAGEPDLALHRSEAHHKNHDEMAVAISQIHCRIEFELPGLVMTFSEITSLRSGSIVQLPNVVDQSCVGVKIEGQRIGSGELVSVGDRLGVRITELSLRDDKDCT